MIKNSIKECTLNSKKDTSAVHIYGIIIAVLAKKFNKILHFQRDLEEWRKKDSVFCSGQTEFRSVLLEENYF
jgi:hypothetical protein